MNIKDTLLKQIISHLENKLQRSGCSYIYDMADAIVGHGGQSLQGLVKLARNPKQHINVLLYSHPENFLMRFYAYNSEVCIAKTGNFFDLDYCLEKFEYSILFDIDRGEYYILVLRQD